LQYNWSEVVSTNHIVVQGEHLSGIAKKYGFSSYKTIWDHGQNAELKKKRQNPNVIFPGDQLFIPDKEEKVESRNTEKKHTFELKAEKLKLRLILEDLYEKPIANAKCELQIENDSTELTTDGQGKIERDIKPTDARVFLTIKDSQTPVNEVLIPIRWTKSRDKKRGLITWVILPGRSKGRVKRITKCRFNQLSRSFSVITR
jgi:LysM repeat protein